MRLISRSMLPCAIRSLVTSHHDTPLPAVCEETETVSTYLLRIMNSNGFLDSKPGLVGSYNLQQAYLNLSCFLFARDDASDCPGKKKKLSRGNSDVEGSDRYRAFQLPFRPNSEMEKETVTSELNRKIEWEDGRKM